MSTTKAAYKHDHPELRALIAAGGSFPARSAVWAALGVWVGASAPGTPITYADWVSGTTGYWGWVVIP